MDRLLVVEDDPAIRLFIGQVLEASGYEVVEAATLREGLVAVGIKKPDLIVLDLGLPDGDGLDLIREMRHWNSSPILVLSARVSDTDKISALDLGADDYLVKPFSAHELSARVRAALRRVHRPGAERTSPVRFGECEFDEKERVVLRQGRRVHLTQVEFRLLAMLVANERQVFTHRQLLRVVWGPAATDHVHYLRIYMGHLRRKLEIDPARPVHFLTEMGVGYRFVPQPPTQTLAGDAADSAMSPATGRLDDLVPQDHPLRPIGRWVSDSWPTLQLQLPAWPESDRRTDQIDITQELLLRAMLLQVLYRISTDRQFLEQLNYNILYRWFVGLAADDAVWPTAVFCTQRDQLLEYATVQAFLHAALDFIDRGGELVSGHFFIDRSLLEQWRHRLVDRPDPDVKNDAAANECGRALRSSHPFESRMV